MLAKFSKQLLNVKTIFIPLSFLGQPLIPLQPIILPHRELGFKLFNRFNNYGHDNQQTRTADSEGLHAGKILHH